MHFGIASTALSLPATHAVQTRQWIPLGNFIGAGFLLVGIAFFRIKTYSQKKSGPIFRGTRRRMTRITVAAKCMAARGVARRQFNFDPTM